MISEYEDAEKLIMQLSDQYAGDVTSVARKGNGRNKIIYYNYPCSFDIETTTIKPGELDYPEDKNKPPIAFPYLFQWCIYGKVIMCRTYSQARDIFRWISEYFRLANNKRLIFFVHNLGYEQFFWNKIWDIIPEECFALDEHHPVTIVTKDGFLFRDSYKMTNMSLETLTKDWSRRWKKNKEIMDYSQLRTPYTELDEDTLIYSALDVLSLSDAIEKFLAARGERIWTRCTTSTSFIRAELKRRIGVGAKKRTAAQHKYFKILNNQKIDLKMYDVLKRLARGGNTHANRFITGKLLENVCHFDIVSSYPAQLVCYPEYPLGEWDKLGPEDDITDLEMFERNGYCCMADIALINPRIKPGVTVPYISISKMVVIEGTKMDASDNGRYLGGLESIAITIFGIEWPIIKEQYDFDDAIILDGYFATKGYCPDIIRQYIIELYEQKTKLKGVKGQEVEYMLSKVACNSLFGCLYTDIIRVMWQVTEDGILPDLPEDPEKFLENYQDSISYFAPYVYGCMTAALGRVYLQKMINAAGEDFCYCDTDSIFATRPEKVRPAIRALEEKLLAKQRLCGMQLSYKDIKGREHELGAIDEEPLCEAFRTYGAKKYITVEDGELKCTIAGVPKKKGAEVIGTAENFKPGLNFPGAVTGKNCLWYNPDPGFYLHDEQDREIEIHYNVAMLPVDYLLSLSTDYMECLSIEGNFHWNFKEADKNVINDEDY